MKRTAARVLAGVVLAAMALTVGRGTWSRLHAAGRSAKPSSEAGRSDTPVDPWTSAQTVQPEELAKELSEAKAGERPTIACVGFRVLYEGGHIPGASYHGPASKDDGLADLKKWAEGLRRSANLVVYCGCCPIARCPNLRPAFTALHTMGFTRLRVLLLPQNFATDWAGKGYPVAKGL